MYKLYINIYINSALWLPEHGCCITLFCLLCCSDWTRGGRSFNVHTWLQSPPERLLSCRHSKRFLFYKKQLNNALYKPRFGNNSLKIRSSVRTNQIKAKFKSLLCPSFLIRDTMWDSSCSQHLCRQFQWFLVWFSLLLLSSSSSPHTNRPHYRHTCNNFTRVGTGLMVCTKCFLSS